MAITADDPLFNVRQYRPSLLESLARLADPAGAIDPEGVSPNPNGDAEALARDMHAVAGDLTAAFDRLRSEADERP